MGTTIDAIGAALAEQLATLGPSPGDATFDLVQWYAGEVTQDGVDQETLGHAPAALLAWEGEDPQAALQVRTLAGGIEQIVARAVWRVYVVVQDLRGENTAMPALLALVAAVQAALTGFPIDGLYGIERVEYLGARPAFIRRGVSYVYMLRFATPYVVTQYEATSDAVPFETLDADLNLIDPALSDAAQYDGNPINQLRAEPEQPA